MTVVRPIYRYLHLQGMRIWQTAQEKATTKKNLFALVGEPEEN